MWGILNFEVNSLEPFELKKRMREVDVWSRRLNMNGFPCLANSMGCLGILRLDVTRSNNRCFDRNG
ncbi:hypothetical protein LguiB_020768 [Lonicera macranthoides]